MLSENLMRDACSVVKHAFGIELEWGEKAVMSQYIESYRLKYEKEIPNRDEIDVKLDIEGLCRFMQDYFGLDVQELGRRHTPPPWRYAGRQFGVKRASGWNFLGYEPFMQYCKNHVQEWRRENNTF